MRCFKETLHNTFAEAGRNRTFKSHRFMAAKSALPSLA